MKLKTSELTGAALDWAVAKCVFGYGADCKENRYSTDWAEGGPIIEREGISTRRFTVGTADWIAYANVDGAEWLHGPTPLIAGMRCYVASKLGDEVEVPDELA